LRSNFTESAPKLKIDSQRQGREVMEKFSIAVAIAFVSILSVGKFAAAEVSKEELKSISTPDKVRTSIGELKLKATTQEAAGTVGRLLRAMTKGS
jgi:hypothetical protein